MTLPGNALRLRDFSTSGLESQEKRNQKTHIYVRPFGHVDNARHRIEVEALSRAWFVNNLEETLYFRISYER